MDNKKGIIVKEVHGELSFNIVLEEIEKHDNGQNIVYILFLPQFPFAKKYYDVTISIESLFSSLQDNNNGQVKTYIKNGKAVTLRNPYYALFTCSCGNMECNGIYDFVYFSYTDTTISWIMDIKTYREVLDIEEEGYLEIIFDRKQYEEAVENLRALLENIDTLSISKEIFNKIDDTFCEDGKISMLKDNDMVNLEVVTPYNEPQYATSEYILKSLKE